MRNKYRARQIDRDSYLVKSQKPLSGPMREKRVGSMCVGWGKEYTLQGMRSRRALWASSADQYKTNVRTLKEFSPWWSIEKKKKCPPGHGSFLQGSFTCLQPVSG